MANPTAKASTLTWGTGIYNARQHGLTLIELLTVLLVIGIGAAAIGLSLMRSNNQIEAHAERLAGYLDSAAQWAQWHRRPLTITLDKGALHAQLADHQSPRDPPLNAPFPLDGAVRLSMQSEPFASLRFAANGLNRPGEVALLSDGSSARVRWDAMNRFSVVLASQ